MTKRGWPIPSPRPPKKHVLPSGDEVEIKEKEKDEETIPIAHELVVSDELKI